MLVWYNDLKKSGSSSIGQSVWKFIVLKLRKVSVTAAFVTALDTVLR